MNPSPETARLSSLRRRSSAVATMTARAARGMSCLLAGWILGGMGFDGISAHAAAAGDAAQGKPGSASAAGATAGASAEKKSATGGELVLFDGKTLAGWKETDFAGRGPVKVEGGRLLLDTGVMTGVTWTNEAALPTNDYEITLEAMRVDGSDFFCGLTFPVGKDSLSFIVGGWGGGVVGLSSVNGEDAAHNETTSYLNFENGKWFKIRLRVTKARIEAWIDADRVVNLETAGKTFSIRPEVELSKPLGLASWSTSAALRNIRVRRL